MTPNRKHFVDDLRDLNEKVYEMGSLVHKNYENLITCCKEEDLDLAKQIYESDSLINELESSINVDAYLLIAKQCPVASDLRRVITSVKISNELERLGDYTANIAKYILKTKNDNVYFLQSIISLTEIFIVMLEKIMQAFDEENTELALQVDKMDEKLDEQYKETVKELINYAKNATETETEEAMRALLVLKQLERAGDHVTNIAENIIYLVNGTRVELN